MAADGDVKSYCSPVRSLNRTGKPLSLIMASTQSQAILVITGDMEMSDIMDNACWGIKLGLVLQKTQ